jgi:hypothetical protein
MKSAPGDAVFSHSLDDGSSPSGSRRNNKFSLSHWRHSHHEVRENARIRKDDTFRKALEADMALTEAALDSLEDPNLKELIEHECSQHASILQELRATGRSSDIGIMTKMVTNARVVVMIDDTRLTDGQVWGEVCK